MKPKQVLDDESRRDKIQKVFLHVYDQCKWDFKILRKRYPILQNSSKTDDYNAQNLLGG